MRRHPFDRKSRKPASRRARYASTAAHRGSLGIDLNSGREDLLAQQVVALLRRERLKVEFDRLADIRLGPLE